MKKVLFIFLMILILLVVSIAILFFVNMKDRHPGYKADMEIISNRSGRLNAGFAAVSITPEVPDRWTDKNNDAKYDPADGDTYTDRNGNGKFDAVWIAGFSNKRAANGVHDDIWARAMIIDDGKTRLAIVILDAIGFMHDDIVDVRKMIRDDLGITYTIIASTHTHEGPDLLGMWGRSYIRSGVDGEYLKYVKNRIIESIQTAVENICPVRFEISEDMTGAISLVKDTREPEVFDSGLRIIRAVDKNKDQTLGSLIAWGNHPETLWSENLLISSDFPHFVREGVERGVFSGDSLVKPGVGGVAVYLNGAIGGLMTTHPSLAVKDPFSEKEIKDATFEKTSLQGDHLSLLVLEAMENPVEKIDSAAISLIVRTISLPVDNTLFKLATALGVMDRGTSGWMKVRTELAVFRIGSLTFVTLPGEIYPEIINGGIEAPEGRDFNVEPLEIPPVREMMSGKYKFVIGLANDEIGYIIPKSQWDVKSPYTYRRKDSPYGEENSLGPETAPVIHANLKKMLEIFKYQ